MRYNAPSLAAGQAPWYMLILFGEEGYGNWGYPLDGYTVIVGNKEASTDSDREGADQSTTH